MGQLGLNVIPTLSGVGEAFEIETRLECKNENKTQCPLVMKTEIKKGTGDTYNVNRTIYGTGGVPIQTLEIVLNRSP